MGEELAPWEYCRAGDGASRHVLQCLCECDDLDRLGDDCVSSVCCSCCDDSGSAGNALDPAARKEVLRRVLATAADRARVPWLGGARRVNAGAVAAPVLLRAAQALCGLSNWAPWVCLCLCAVAAHLAWFHVTCLTLPWRTDYFSSWIAFSILGVYREYAGTLLPEQSWCAATLMHLLLGVVLVSFAVAALQRPAPRVAPGEQREDAGEASPDVPLRTDRVYACRVCGDSVYLRDHHCVWINQCVGAHNHRAFVVFVGSFAVLALCYAVAVLGARPAAATSGPWRLPPAAGGALYAAGGGLFALGLTVGQIANIGTGLTAHERMRLDRCGAGPGGGRHRQRAPGHGGLAANWRAWCAGGRPCAEAAGAGAPGCAEGRRDV